ncbi:hypothetical protein BKA62DRAFT_792395 [Auriculariales sp. MPI-PUGE-AT-0066]|nr:hypothetical protein BKA62DRAFT_792395 [Auriculariales sp. MPI-PUGE-AT-0066]
MHLYQHWQNWTHKFLPAFITLTPHLLTGFKPWRLADAHQASRQRWIKHWSSVVLHASIPITLNPILRGVNVPGGDVHIAVDGNFNQKHCESAGDCPAISARSFNFVPRWWTDAVDAALEAAGRKPTPYTGTVPEATVVACENSHKAGRGDQKAAGAEHDDKGLIALKYAVGLILWLLLRVPSAMKIVVLYDIACVTARTLNTRNILMPGRLQSRMITGMGLTDGEGVERLWSLLVDLIGILRKVSRSRRIVILERQIQWIADCLREELGCWGRRRAGAVEEKRTAASRDLATCGYDTKTLRSLWEEQRQSQLSIREATKPLLKQDMKTIHDLQETVDALDDKIDRAEISLTRGARNAKIKCGLVELRNQRDQLVERIESLYMSLNIADNFPHIKSLGNEFVQLLVQTYNTKALLRARVVGRIFEFHFLDRAVGGCDIPLGYKQNQQRRQQLKRGTPVIERLRDRYNGLVEQLHDIAKKKKIDFPLPVSLPPNILSLRDDPALMEDVWLGASENNTPLWLTDPKARIGIRAMQLLDRCDEESARLNRELAQLADWLAHHWERVQLAKEDDSHGRYAPWLRDETLQLEDLAFGCGIKNFGRWAQSRLGGPDRPSVHSSPTFLDISQPGTSNSRVFGDVEEDESDRGSDCDDLEGQRDVADDLATFLSQLSH